MAGEKIISMMSDIATEKMRKGSDVVVGKVITASPLVIRLGNTDLKEEFLIVGALCQETKITLTLDPHSHTTQAGSTGNSGDSATSTDSAGTIPDSDHSHTGPSHSHSTPSVSTNAVELEVEVLLWRGLQPGDSVYMLKHSEGNKYYVLQRKEGVYT